MKDETDIVQKLLQHDEDVPVPADHERRIREGLANLLGGPPTPPSGDGGPPQGGGGGGAGSPPPPASPLGKWLATTVIVAGAAAGGGFLAGRATTTAPIAASAPPSSVPVVAAPPLPSPTPCAQDTATPPRPSTSSAVSAKPTSTAPNAQDAFDKEQSLLERARSALVRHDAVLAEQALDECEKQFPKSRHAEERDYLRIQVTREKGDVEKTRALAQAFLTKYPQSLLKARVEQLAR